MSWSKGKLRTVTINGVDWKYIVEANAGRKSELRIYEPGTKQIKQRVDFKELDFDDWIIEYGACQITPLKVKEYIKKNLI